MFNTPNGIAVVDVAKIGTARRMPRDRRAAAAADISRGARREIYFTADAAGGRGGAGAISAVNVDTRQIRDVPHARGLINADETLSVVKNANAADPDGQYPRPPARAAVPQLQRMFPGKRMEDLTPDQQYSVTKEDGLAPRALNPGLQSFVFTDLKTGASRETGFPVRRPESHAVQSGRSRTCCSIATKARGTSWIGPGRSAPTAARCG